jgi:hypothetical protein
MNEISGGTNKATRMNIVARQARSSRHTKTERPDLVVCTPAFYSGNSGFAVPSRNRLA